MEIYKHPSDPNFKTEKNKKIEKTAMKDGKFINTHIPKFQNTEKKKK